MILWPPTYLDCHEIAPGVYEAPVVWNAQEPAQFIGVVEPDTDPYSRALEAWEERE